LKYLRSLLKRLCCFFAARGTRLWISERYGTERRRYHGVRRRRRHVPAGISDLDFVTLDVGGRTSLLSAASFSFAVASIMLLLRTSMMTSSGVF